MLAVFENKIANPPEELSLPFKGSRNLKTKEEVAALIGSGQADLTRYMFCNGDFMALSHQDEHATCPRSSVVKDDIFCIFNGYLHNTCDLRRRYGLSRQATEAMIVVEAYKVLRDRAPYPADQVIKELDGKFSFILFDAKATKLFLARDPEIVRKSCGDRYPPFPPGCLFKSEEGLISFDHPLNKVRGIVREEDEGYNSSAVIFQVDLLTRRYSIPRRGSDANWASVSVTTEGD
ncbi:putative nucleophile aminohydrolase [Helianthus annuus]|uniref:Nucleophile aminohydrolase n=1 Tax=Helianthus annuus TaxID=4232 RepID=A0A251V2I1_HELAN|nr:putative nucleophile aminohydrolase [Helianthus annuus]KAJ0590810.1 putative nucleophile aminohydrolase [Helianthus annuus]KAJ0759120.1 putative stem-specific protein TSJT1 [Helianthus annuus]KAJ0762773.1 putative stem-specific protein TSJT1 [Helianthus annuus]KAJ0928692.1 putative nucleophile aminohydrolase [Helianthus annuus]